MTGQGGGWWEWLGWTGSENKLTVTSQASLPVSEKEIVNCKNDEVPCAVLAQHSELTGWQRLENIYTNEHSMELDVVKRVVRMSFLGGFLVGGATGYAQARHAYETNNVGRKYLSPSDAVKRRIDYAIVRFAKSGFSVGLKCALISGSIVLLTTHATAYRDKFSSWYFPAISGATAYLLHTVGSVFTFPLGLIGSVKAIGLGVSSGLTLTAVVHLYAMAIDKSVNEAYKLFKRDYEKEMKSAADWDSRVQDLMEREKITWRQTAVKKLKQMDHEKMTIHDD